MSVEDYTLGMVYRDAGIEPYPEWADEIQVVIKDGLGRRCKARASQLSGLALNFQFDNTRAALFDDMGSGKTLIAQLLLIWYAAYGAPGVVLMPPILTSQWLRSFHATFPGLINHLQIETYVGTPKQRDKIVDRWKGRPPDIVILGYDIFRMEWLLFTAFKGRSPLQDYKVLVLDEGKTLRDLDSKTSLAVRRFMREPGEKAALVMQGTPAENNLLDLHGYIEFLTPGVYVNRVHFIQRHVKYVKIKTTYYKKGQLMERVQSVIDSFKRLDILHKNLYLQARRIEKKDVMELKGIQTIRKEFDLAPRHAHLYKRLVTERLLMFDDGKMIDITASTAVRHACMRAITHTSSIQLETPSVLYEMIDQILDELDLTEKKVALGCHYRETVEYLAQRYAKYNPAIVYGGSDGPSEKDRFLDSDDCRMIIMNYQSGGVGIDGLQRVCSDAIAVEPCTVDGRFEQWKARFDRSGQMSPVSIYLLIPTGTCYVQMMSDLAKKRRYNSAVVSAEDLEAELLGVEIEKPLTEEEIDKLLQDW